MLELNLQEMGISTFRQWNVLTEREDDVNLHHLQGRMKKLVKNHL